MSRPHWIVVGTDFSESSTRALSLAIDLAARDVANVALVHAYVDPPGSTDVHPELLARLHEEIERSDAARRRVHVEPLLRRGRAWDKLQNVATDMGASMIVIGGRGAGEQLVGGLVEQVITTSRGVVVVISHLDEQGRL